MTQNGLRTPPLPASAPTADLDAAARLFDPSRTPTWELLHRARKAREKRFGNRVHLCAIINAKSGVCSENCAFCAQSRHHASSPPVYPLISVERALEAAERASSHGARCFSLVASGRSLTGRRERKSVLRIVEAIRARTDLEAAVSLGLLDPGFLRDLKNAGLSTLHHNLETAPGFYGAICTTHSFEERLETVLRAREAGLRVCSGGIFGLGESFRHRAELALLLKELEVERVPVNFLHAIPGTPLAGTKRMAPLEALHALAALRLLLPDREILVCGGREVVLRSLQPLVFLAGANGIMTGNYLTTAGQGAEQDRRMLEDLGVPWRRDLPTGAPEAG